MLSLTARIEAAQNAQSGAAEVDIIDWPAMQRELDELLLGVLAAA